MFHQEPTPFSLNKTFISGLEIFWRVRFEEKRKGKNLELSIFPK